MFLKNLMPAMHGLIGLAMALGVSSSYAESDYYDENHYTAFKVSAARNSIPFGFNVGLKDRFFSNYSSNSTMSSHHYRWFTTGKAEWIWAPTRKIIVGPQSFGDETSPIHYVGYPVSPHYQHDYDFTVNVYNQFGEFTLNAFTPHYFMTPSLKFRFAHNPPTSVTGPTFANAIDNFIEENNPDSYYPREYLCYQTNIQNVNTSVFGRIIHQFFRRPFAGFETAHLCNSVSRHYNDGQAEPQHHSSHLMCFTFRNLFGIQGITMRMLSQFGLGYLSIYSDDELCVPAGANIAPTDLCEDSLQLNGGVCNGACPVGGDVCVPNGSTGHCHCVTPPNNN